MDLPLYSKDGDLGSTVSVSDAAFGQEYNEPLIHQVIVAYQAAGRSGTVKQKNRAEVSGGGKKPWRQKGMGRARSGTSSSPIWRSGGATFASRPRSYKQKVNRKMYRGAMRSLFSELVRQNRFAAAEEVSIEEAKTKVLAAKLEKMNLNSVLFIVENDADVNNLSKAAGNLYKVDVAAVNRVSPVDLASYEKVVATVPAIRQVEEWLG